MPEIPSEMNAFHVEHVQLLMSSFHKFIGTELIAHADSEPVDLAKQVFEAPFVVLSHGIESDPIFNYANQTAMELFEMDWPTITSLPSRKSAEPMNRAERERLLTAVAEENYIDDYAGVRISSSGRRFHIPQAIVWNLVNDRDERLGQAATFSAWKFLD